MMKTMITLTATAVLLAITSNVAEAAKINPNPIGKPVTGGSVFEGKKSGPTCDYDLLNCRTFRRDRCRRNGLVDRKGNPTKKC